MPNIINDVKLDFKDVLLRPKRSTLKSRSEVRNNNNLIYINKISLIVLYIINNLFNIIQMFCL